MIAIVPVGDTPSNAFYSSYSECESLIIYARHFGISDIVIFSSPPDADINTPFSSYRLKKYLSRRSFDNFLKKFLKTP